MRSLCLAALACALLAAPARPADVPQIKLPSQSTATFHRDALHSVYLLFQRRPVLVVCWRADNPVTVNEIIPAMLALEQEQGGDLALLFVERSGLSYEAMLKVLVQRKWLCGTAAWTCEVPAGAETLEAPAFALVSPTLGTTAAGHPVTDEKKLRKELGYLIEDRRTGEPNLPADVRDAIKALHEGRFVEALSLPATALAYRKRGKPGDYERSDDIEKLVHVIDDDLNARIEWTNEMILSGTGAAVRPRLEALCKGLAALPADNTFRRRAEDQLAALGHGDLAAELKASAELFKYQDQLCAKGPSVSLSKALQKVIKANATTHAVGRLELLMRVATP